MKFICSWLVLASLFCSARSFAEPKTAMELRSSSFIGEEGGVIFKAKGGGFVPMPSNTACDTYPRCPEIFRKSWREKCSERTTTVALSAEKKLIEAVDDKWVGKCNAYGDAPQVKSIVSESDKPTWLFDIGNGTALATWTYDGGYMHIFGYCKSMWDSSPIKSFRNCNAMQVTIKAGSASADVKDKLKVNNFGW